jgi:hypothetical protein
MERNCYLTDCDIERTIHPSPRHTFASYYTKVCTRGRRQKIAFMKAYQNVLTASRERQRSKWNGLSMEDVIKLDLTIAPEWL